MSEAAHKSDPVLGAIAADVAARTGLALNVFASDALSSRTNPSLMRYWRIWRALFSGVRVSVSTVISGFSGGS